MSITVTYKCDCCGRIERAGDRAGIAAGWGKWSFKGIKGRHLLCPECDTAIVDAKESAAAAMFKKRRRNDGR